MPDASVALVAATVILVRRLGRRFELGKGDFALAAKGR